MNEERISRAMVEVVINGIPQKLFIRDTLMTVEGIQPFHPANQIRKNDLPRHYSPLIFCPGLAVPQNICLGSAPLLSLCIERV
jgi:hypothetical protein